MYVYMSVHTSNLAVGYIRVSTEEQALEGVSLDAQRSKIEAWSTAHGFSLIGICEDAGISGSSAAKRKGLKEAVALASKNKAALVVHSLSRLARSLRDAIVITDDLEKAKADLVSLTESIDTTTASGRMFFHILAALSQFERDLISERTHAAMEHKRLKQERFSRRPPYGFDFSSDGKGLTKNRTEHRLIKRMLSWRERGETLREICARLELEGAPTKSGGSWYPLTVRAILNRHVKE